MNTSPLTRMSTPADLVVRAAVVDDEPMARDVVVSLLRDLPMVQVIGQAGNGRDAGARLRLTSAYTLKLEQLIDRENEKLAPLKSFILPGGTMASAWLHLARNVCRRAERLVTELREVPGEHERVNLEVVK